MERDQPYLRREDPPLLRGEARFVDDIRLDGELAMAMVRAPVAAGKIEGIDCSAALAIDGVRRVVTGAELAGLGFGAFRSGISRSRPDGSDMLDTPCPILATDHVQFAGDPVACVFAESPQAALDGAEAVLIEIEPAAAVTDVRRAAMPDAPVVWPGAPDNIAFRMEAGDGEAVATAFEGAKHVIELDFDITRVTASPMETRGVLASYDPESDRITLWTGTQVPHRYAGTIAKMVPGLNADGVHIPRVEIGGGFGMRNTPAREAVLAAWAAREFARPVRWIATRSEGFLSDTHGRDRFTHAELALDGDGRFLALRADALVALGGYIATNGLVPAVVHYGGVAGVYRIPAIEVSITGVLTNTQPTTPYRGAGRPEATYTIERLIDVAASKLGIDRAELRRRNLVQPEDIPYTTALGNVYDSGDFPRVLATALESADWDGFEARRNESRARGLMRGIGLAMPIEGAGGPYGAPGGEFAELRFTEAGEALLFLGSGDTGQGHRTAFAQLAAERLGLDPDEVTVTVGDTDTVLEGFGSTGSRTALSAGTAVHEAGRLLIEKGRAVAAEQLGVHTGGIEFSDGVFRETGGNRSLSWRELAAGHADALAAAGTFKPADATFPNGCHVCEVELDPETGSIAVDRYLVVEDVGTVISPMIVEGQLHGGVAQGLGQALMEQIVYDENAQLLTGSFMDYAMPRADDMAAIQVQSCPAPTPNNPIGAKGAGEAGTVGALPAVMSAVCNALEPLGINHIDMPASPFRIWKAINDAQSS